jgi:hypothetical protein
MPGAFASRNVGLVKSPSLRQQAARRRLLAVCGLLLLALASGAVGALSERHAEVLGKPQTGPFSYFS